MRFVRTSVAVLVVALAIGASTASAAPQRVAHAQASACFFAKTKFVLHAGLAFYAFHHYIYDPFKAGSFSGPHKTSTIAKAAAAALVVYHEMNEALGDAKCSGALSTLVSPITAALGLVQSAASTLKSGGVPDISTLGTTFDALGASASGAGSPIKDIVSSI
jgi:hypothetical protein